MTTVEFRAYVKNVYQGCSTLEQAPNAIPAGEGNQVARIAIAALLNRETIDVPKV